MTAYPTLDTAERLARMTLSGGPVRMVLDTDTYNEIDDQFAVVHALRSPDQVRVEAIYAAPFLNGRSSSPADGMQKSYEELERILARLEVPTGGLVWKGSTAFLQDPAHPCESEAAQDLVRRARGAQTEPLYVVAIGAITNVASAILMAPEIIRNIVVVWLGGHALHWPHTREFNLIQDIASARVLFDCGVPLIQLPCEGVVSHLHTSIPEMAAHVKGRGAIGDYLFEIFCDYGVTGKPWSKVIWDIAATAALITPAAVKTELVHSPIVTDQGTWSVDRSRHLIRSASRVNRDAILEDFITKLPPRTP